jgi:hypothetical protein
MIFIFLVLILVMSIRNKFLISSNTKPSTRGCSVSEFGCCPDNLTPKLSPSGANCITKTNIPPPPPIPQPPPQPIGGCAGTQYGCCADGVTPSIDSYGSNCLKL